MPVPLLAVAFRCHSSLSHTIFEEPHSRLGGTLPHTHLLLLPLVWEGDRWVTAERAFLVGPWDPVVFPSASQFPVYMECADVCKPPSVAIPLMGDQTGS